MILRLALSPAARFDALVLGFVILSLCHCLRFVSDSSAYAQVLVLMLLTSGAYAVRVEVPHRFCPFARFRILLRCCVGLCGFLLSFYKSELASFAVRSAVEEVVDGEIHGIFGGVNYPSLVRSDDVDSAV